MLSGLNADGQEAASGLINTLGKLKKTPPKIELRKDERVATSALGNGLR